MRLDLWLLISTVLVVAAPRQLLTVAQVRQKMRRLASSRFRESGAVGFVLLWCIAGWSGFIAVLPELP